MKADVSRKEIVRRYVEARKYVSYHGEMGIGINMPFYCGQLSIICLLLTDKEQADIDSKYDLG